MLTIDCDSRHRPCGPFLRHSISTRRYEEQDLGHGAFRLRTLLEPAADDYGGFDHAHYAGEHNGSSAGTLLLSRGTPSGKAIRFRYESPCDNAVRQSASVLHATGTREFSSPPRFKD